ncbi:ATP-binding cassette domain-containing protein [Paenibacillus rhizophilus]|uniref:ATP-binding cassette domain-containing protein n=1 Tax=Paenibacillus rhizophilus TaxID=1850366 RepID=A0A3N9PCS9_9BACL|nr:ATP-binding cassette domain-containing protein [Paenibacillus rhizophilus]
MDSILKVSNASWKRGTETLLDQVNWSIEKGQNWALMGLNGSGKTTLLNIINGYIWPTDGEIYVLGERFGEIDLKLRKSIGCVSSSLQEKLHGSDRTQLVVISGKHASIGLYANAPEEDYERAWFDSGETSRMLNEETLSRFFEAPVTARHSGGRTYIFPGNNRPGKGES